MRHVLPLALLLAAGCVVHERVPPPDPPPPPPPPSAPPAPPRMLTKREAVRVAVDFAEQRGLRIDRYRAKLDPHGHWRIELRGDRDRDRAKLLVDARSGKVLKAKLREGEPDWDD